MFRALMLAAPLAAALALPAAAFDPAAMSDAERSAFRAEVRAYLLENPDIIQEMVEALQERQLQEMAVFDRQVVAQNAAELFADGRSWVGGNPEGDITVVEFLDYRCGFCRQAFPEVNELLARDKGIRFVVKELPVLGDASVLASRFAIATRNVAGPDAYKQVHDAMMQLRGDFTEPALRMLAMQLGLDAEAIFAGMEDSAVDDELIANHELAARMQIRGTPAFVLGNQLERGALSLGRMEEIIAGVRG